MRNSTFKRVLTQILKESLETCWDARHVVSEWFLFKLTRQLGVLFQKVTRCALMHVAIKRCPCVLLRKIISVTGLTRPGDRPRS